MVNWVFDPSMYEEKDFELTVLSEMSALKTG